MPDNKDLFAPPTDDELKMFAPPSPEELGQGGNPDDKSMAQNALETVSDATRLGIRGLTAGTSTQIIPGAEAAIDKLKGSDEDWKDLYRKYQGQYQEGIKKSQERSPIASTVGEIGGALLPAVLTAGATAPETMATMGLGKLAATGAGMGAAQGALYSGATSEKGHLIGSTPEERQKLLSDVENGAATGAVVGGVLAPAAKVVPDVLGSIKNKVGSKISNFLEDSPFWSQAAKSKELGEEGVNIYSRAAKYGETGEANGLINRDTNAAKDLVDRIYKVDSHLGQQVGSAIDHATEQGITVDLSQPMLDSVETFKKLLENDQTLMANPKAQKLYDTIFQMKDFDAGNLTPKEVQSLRDDVINFADSVKQKNPDIAALGYQFQSQIGGILKDTVPEYRTAAERFESFRRLVPETIISGPVPVDVSKIKLGNLKNDEAKLFSKAKEMIQGSEVPGAGSNDASETYKNFISGLKQFDDSELVRAKKGLIDPTDMPKLIDANNESQADAMAKLIRDKADTSALLRQAWRVNPQEGASTSIKGATFGRASVMNIANKYGLYKDALTKPVSAPVNLAKKMYSASEDELRAMASKMQDIPGISPIGHALQKGLDNKDITGTNAAIFSILQNPQARILVNGEKTDSEGEGK